MASALRGEPCLLLFEIYQEVTAMKKSMYSLMLSEDVIRAVDKLAAEQATNRSNLVNQILAEYLSVTTPEKHVQNIFDIIEHMIGNNSAYVLYSQPHDMTMSIKSSLHYHYRPTIRYEVEMYRMPNETIGQLKIIFRTTSSALLLELTHFFKIWMQLENIYIKHFFAKNAVQYGMENGRFLRTFAVPNDSSYGEEEIGKAIGNYISTFDEMLKAYLAGQYADTQEIENRYLQYLNSGVQLI